MTRPPRLPGAGLPLRPAGTQAEGRARLADEAARVAQITARAAPPASVGPDVPVAPARGAMVVETPFETRGNARVRSGHQAPGEAAPRDRARAADIWDRMDRDARLRHDRRGAEAAFVPAFTSAQVAQARLYRALVERHSAGGVQCASLEARVSGGSGGGGFADAFLAEGRQIEAMRRRIGDGCGMALRRLRPSASASGKGGRSRITDRALVDAVALGQQTVQTVLRRHGWAASGEVLARARAVLAAALDRMQGR